MSGPPASTSRSKVLAAAAFILDSVYAFLLSSGGTLFFLPERTQRSIQSASNALFDFKSACWKHNFILLPPSDGEDERHVAASETPG